MPSFVLSFGSFPSPVRGSIQGAEWRTWVQEQFGVPRDPEAFNPSSLMALSCSSVVPLDLCGVKIRLKAFDTDNFL